MVLKVNFSFLSTFRKVLLCVVLRPFCIPGYSVYDFIQFMIVCIVHVMSADLSMSVLIGTLKSKEGML